MWLKSRSKNGQIITQVLVEKKFFSKSTFQLSVAAGSFEFGLQLAELTRLFDEIDSNNQFTSLKYPVNDNQLQIFIVDMKADAQTDELLLVGNDVYMDIFAVDDDLDVGLYFNSAEVAAQFVSTATFFKSALQEFSKFGGTENLTIIVSNCYPTLQFKYENLQQQVTKCISFDANIEGF